MAKPSDTQATGTTIGRSSQVPPTARPARPAKKAPGAFGNDFEDSDDDDETPPLPPPPLGELPTKGKQGRRVTIQVPVLENGGDGRVQYPELRDFVAGEHAFSSSRRISAARFEYASEDLEIAHQYEEEDGAMAEYLTLYHAREDGTIDKHNVVAQVGTVEEFVKSMSGNATEWFAVLNKYTDLQDSMTEDINNAAAMLSRAEEAHASAAQAAAATEQRVTALQEEMETFRHDVTEQHTAQASELEAAKTTIEQARSSIQRVRTKRDDAVRQLKEAEDTIQEMQKALDKKDSKRKKENKRKKDRRRQKKHRERSDFDPSDDSTGSSSDSSSDSSDDESRGHRDQSPSPPPHRRSGRRHTPVTEFTDRDTTEDHDPRYPHISTYSGKVEEDLEQWIATAETKFRRSHKNYPDEWSKVEYLRGYCAGAAYETVKSRALPQSNRRYKHRQDLYDDLTENFGVPDKKKAALDRIFNGKVKQAEHEKVGTWISRFNVLAIEAGLDQTSKMFLALANLNAKFKTAATQNAKPNESWAEFVARMRAVEQSAAAAYGTNTNPSRRNESKSTDAKKEEEKKKGKKAGGRDKDDEYGSYRPKEQFERIIQKKVCAKCFKSDHKFNDPAAPCKDKKKTPFSVFESLFVVDEDEEALKAKS